MNKDPKAVIDCLGVIYSETLSSSFMFIPSSVLLWIKAV